MRKKFENSIFDEVIFGGFLFLKVIDYRLNDFRGNKEVRFICSEIFYALEGLSYFGALS